LSEDDKSAQQVIVRSIAHPLVSRTAESDRRWRHCRYRTTSDVASRARQRVSHYRV